MSFTAWPRLVHPLKSGTVPIKIKNDEILLGFITSREFPDRFILPKGHIDKNETAEKAALRETREEAGWAGRIIGEPICIGKNLNISHLPKVFISYYPLLVSKVLKNWPEKKYRSRIWITADAIDDIKCYRGTQNVIRELHALYGKKLSRLVRDHKVSKPI